MSNIGSDSTSIFDVEQQLAKSYIMNIVHDTKKQNYKEIFGHDRGIDIYTTSKLKFEFMIYCFL